MTRTLMLSFDEADKLLSILKKTLRHGFKAVEVLSPIPLVEVNQLLGKDNNRLRYYPFFGAIAGFIAGFLLASISAAIYPHPAGGRAIIAIPPYLVIAYEFAILFGVIGSVFGLLICAGLPALKERPYVSSASCNQFVLIIQGLSPAQEQEIQNWALLLGGAEIRLLQEPAAKAIKAPT